MKQFNQIFEKLSDEFEIKSTDKKLDSAEKVGKKAAADEVGEFDIYAHAKPVTSIAQPGTTTTKKGMGELTDIRQWDYEMFKRAIMDAYRSKKPLLVYGDPGIGKSAIAINTSKQIASRMGIKSDHFVNWSQAPRELKEQIINEEGEGWFILIDVRPIGFDTSTIQGIPDFSSDDKKDIKWLETRQERWIYIMSMPKSNGILFLDEVNQANEDVQKTLFSVLLDRTAYETALNRSWGIVAAGNMGTVFGSHDLTPALISRFSRMGILVAKPAQWIKYAREEGVDKRILSFIMSGMGDSDETNCEYFYKPASDQYSQWVTPRHLEMLSDDIKEVEKIYKDYHKRHGSLEGVEAETDFANINDKIYEMAADMLGIAWANKFKEFINNISFFEDVDNWDAVIKDPKKYTDKTKVSTNLRYALGCVVLVNKIIWLTNHDLGWPNVTNKSALKYIGDLTKILNAFDDEWFALIIAALNKENREASIKFLNAALTSNYTSTEKEKMKSRIPIIANIVKDLKSFEK